MSQLLLNKIREMLQGKGVNFRQIHHEPTATSEDSARARGEELRIGGKAILLKTDGRFCLFVLSAALRIDSGAIRRYLSVRKTRFATATELGKLTQLVPGAVPPFGRPLLPFDLYVDRSILESNRIAFNAGSLTDSIILSVQDYLDVADPQVFNFSKS